MAPRLRSTVGALDKVSDVEPEVDSTAPPPKKRKKVDVPRFQCTSCSTLRMTKFFPNVNPSSECEHLINTCTACLKKWVEARVGDTNFEFGSDGKTFGVRCPECPSVMRDVNVQAASTRKVLARFKELARRHVADTVPGWRWCLNPQCKEGQVHEKKAETQKPMNAKKNAKKSAKKQAPEGDICICHACGHQACIPCDRPDHAPETCFDYQTRTKGHTKDEAKSRAKLLKISKPCPSCSKPIEKNGGCNTMQCFSCRTKFCWECLEAYSETGCRCDRRAREAQADAIAAAHAAIRANGNAVR